MIDIPAGGWRHEVAGWPHDRWSAWHRRVGELLGPAGPDGSGPDDEEIRQAQCRAYRESRLFEGKAMK